MILNHVQVSIHHHSLDINTCRLLTVSRPAPQLRSTPDPLVSESARERAVESWTVWQTPWSRRGWFHPPSCSLLSCPLCLYTENSENHFSILRPIFGVSSWYIEKRIMSKLILLNGLHHSDKLPAMSEYGKKWIYLYFMRLFYRLGSKSLFLSNFTKKSIIKAVSVDLPTESFF